MLNSVADRSPSNFYSSTESSRLGDLKQPGTALAGVGHGDSAPAAPLGSAGFVPAPRGSLLHAWKEQGARRRGQAAKRVTGQVTGCGGGCR